LIPLIVFSPMKAIVLCLAILSVALACEGPLQVRLLVFSGEWNPFWTIKGERAEFLCSLMNKRNFNPYTMTTLGYQGFFVKDSNKKEYLVLNDPAVEYALLMTAPELSQTVYEYVFEAIGNPNICKSTEEGCINSFFEQDSSDADCDSTPIVGPDTVPDYDPMKDNKGCFVTKQYYNNCYNYGNDIVTNTFAKPGRATGHMFDYNTCDSVREAAVRDGLKWIGTELPADKPDEGHYISLMIWPNTNFHWARKDSSGYWSHKAGQTAVRDTDNSGRKIPDASKANWYPWSTFCGYMETVPSKVQIK